MVSMTAVRYRDKVLDSTMRKYAAIIGSVFVLTDDNARPHGAVLVEFYLQSERIAHMDWRRTLLILTPLKIFGIPQPVLFPPPVALIEFQNSLQKEWLILDSTLVLLYLMVSTVTHCKLCIQVRGVHILLLLPGFFVCCLFCL